MTIILVTYGVSREEVGGNNLVIAPVWEVFHSVFDFGIELERSIALILCLSVYFRENIVLRLNF
jgi:hypothetical protein